MGLVLGLPVLPGMLAKFHLSVLRFLTCKWGSASTDPKGLFEDGMSFSEGGLGWYVAH